MPTNRSKLAPGDQVGGGYAITLHDDGVMIGRLAEEGETCPPRHSEHVFKGRRFLLSHDQVRIPYESALAKKVGK